MAKKKGLTTLDILKLFVEGVNLYFKNLPKFLKYMAFPVLGQVLAMFLIFTTVHLFTNNLDKLIYINPALDNISILMIILLVLIIPSFLIFFAAFWKYVVAMGALNSMANNIISGAKLENLSIHNDTVNRRMGTFLGLILILSLISLLMVVPFVFLIMIIIMIFLSLSFQVFALEENLKTFGIIKKSFKMVKSNFLKTAFLLFLLWFFTYYFVPEIFNLILYKLDLYKYLIIPIVEFCKDLPLAEVEQTINTIFTAVNNNSIFQFDVISISEKIVAMIFASIIIGFTLPLRSICCTLLYKNIEIKKLKEKKLKDL